MKYLLELCGYEIVNIYGGYHKESAETVSRNVIWCVRKGIQTFPDEERKNIFTLKTESNGFY